MEGIWQWGIDLIRAIQTVHGPVLDAIFTGITFLGNEDFFFLLLPLMLWCVDFVVGVRLSIAFVLSSYLNVGLKSIFAHPRPFMLEPSVKLHDVNGYGFPSGHAQGSVVVWGVIAAELRKRWLWVVAIALMVLVGFSRIYLGVHFPTDVFVGWVVGGLFLWAYMAWASRIEAWLKRMGPLAQIGLATAVAVVLALIYPADEVLSVMGVFLGAVGGVVLLPRVVAFRADGPWWQRAVRLVLGLVILMGLRFGLKAIFPGEGEPFYVALRFVRYAVIGLWVTFGAPWLFVKLRLAPVE